MLRKRASESSNNKANKFARTEKSKVKNSYFFSNFKICLFIKIFDLIPKKYFAYAYGADVSESEQDVEYTGYTLVL